MSNLSDALIIFVKNPELGKCKTRLAATIGDDAALIVYKNLLEHTRKVALECPINRHLFYSDSISKNDDWPNDKFFKSLQFKGDLGQRMSNAFETVLQQNHKAAIIGSDCPEISKDIVEQALKALDQNDIVIGPTHDGGYYLLGMKKLEKSLFENIEWSTDSVFQSTIDKAKDSALKYAVLQQLSDLDYEEDLEKFPAFK